MPCSGRSVLHGLNPKFKKNDVKFNNEDFCELITQGTILENYFGQQSPMSETELPMQL